MGECIARTRSSLRSTTSVHYALKLMYPQLASCWDFSGFLFLTIILHNSNIQKRSCFISDKDEIAPWFHFTLRAHLPSSFLLHNVQDPCRTTHFFRFTRPASGRTSKTLVSGSFQPHLSAILCETILIFYFFRSKPFSVSVCSSLCKFFSFVKQISAGSTC